MCHFKSFVYFNGSFHYLTGENSHTSIVAKCMPGGGSPIADDACYRFEFSPASNGAPYWVLRLDTIPENVSIDDALLVLGNVSTYIKTCIHHWYQEGIDSGAIRRMKVKTDAPDELHDEYAHLRNADSDINYEKQANQAKINKLRQNVKTLQPFGYMSQVKFLKKKIAVLSDGLKTLEKGILECKTRMDELEPVLFKTEYQCPMPTDDQIEAECTAAIDNWLETQKAKTQNGGR